MQMARYDFAIDTEYAAWKVVDLATGKVACLGGQAQSNLSLDEADDMASLLNRVLSIRAGQELSE